MRAVVMLVGTSVLTCCNVLPVVVANTLNAHSWFKGTYFAMAFNVDVLGMFTHRDYSRDAAQPIPTVRTGISHSSFPVLWVVLDRMCVV